MNDKLAKELEKFGDCIKQNDIKDFLDGGCLSSDRVLLIIYRKRGFKSTLTFEIKDNNYLLTLEKETDNHITLSSHYLPFSVTEIDDVLELLCELVKDFDKHPQNIDLSLDLTSKEEIIKILIGFGKLTDCEIEIRSINSIEGGKNSFFTLKLGNQISVNKKLVLTLQNLGNTSYVVLTEVLGDNSISTYERIEFEVEDVGRFLTMVKGRLNAYLGGFANEKV